MSSQKRSTSHLKQVQEKIVSGLEYLQQLNSKYIIKQEKSFKSAFLSIVDKMSNQLFQAHQHYRNIDQEISNDHKCVALANKLSFYQKQCFQLGQQLDQTKLKILQQKMKQQKLKEENNNIKQILRKKITRIQKYRSISVSASKSSRYQSENRNLYRSIDLGKKYDSKQKTTGRQIYNESFQYYDDIRSQQIPTPITTNRSFYKNKIKSKQKKQQITQHFDAKVQENTKIQNKSYFKNFSKQNKFFS